MPASSDRLLVSSLRPWMPAENEPAEPKALMQSLQLTCSLTPSSTVPSTRLVIIWLKRWLARPLTELPLESEPVGVGLGDGYGLGDGEGEYVGDGLGLGSPHSDSQVAWAAAGRASSVTSASAAAALNALARTKHLKPSFAIISARTACRRHGRRA